MEKVDFKNLPDKTTPINAANLNKMQDNTEKAIGEKLDKTSKATSTEAIAGTNNTKYTTPYSVKSAIDKALEGYTPSGGGSGGDTLPIGSIVAFSGENIPNGWLLCDGSVVSRTTYSELFNAIGLNYVEDGVEWLDEERFPLPNAKGRTLVGKDSTDTDFNKLGKTSGEKTHTLTVDEMPSHKHSMNFGDSAGGDGSGFVYSSTSGNNNVFMLETGGGQTHNNLQPSLTLNYIIKAKNTAVVKGDVIQEDGTASETNVYSASAMDNRLKTNIVTGQEVATNEYVDGKQVFVKRVEFTFPTTINAWTTLIQLDSTVDDLIDKKLRYYSGGENYDFPYNFENEEIACYFNKNNKTLNVKTNFSYPSGKPGWGILKYTKN